MKRRALSLLLACLGLAVLLLAAGCIDASRDPIRNTNSLTGVIEAEIQSDHFYYEFGEPVRLHVTLKNVSREPQTLGNGTGPVVDIRLEASGVGREWAQEHPNDVKRQVILKPGESYIVEWIVTPTVRASYGVTAWWTDSTGKRVEMGIGVHYGMGLPGRP
jgi:hypothetical protein